MALPQLPKSLELAWSPVHNIPRKILRKVRDPRWDVPDNHESNRTKSAEIAEAQLRQICSDSSLRMQGDPGYLGSWS